MLLSVLDQSPVRKGGSAADAVAETIKLAKACDGLGYHRYWLAEHHNSNSLAGSAPEILIGKVASETKHIRVGSGGVMLTHYSPLKVAEQFRMLEVLTPGRIDLGLGRAPGTDQRTSSALQAGIQGWDIDMFPTQVKFLCQWLEDSAGIAPMPADHPYRGVHAQPRGPSVPEVWMLGSGIHGAVYAAELGLPFCHAYFINTDGSEQACEEYRTRFRPSRFAEKPMLSMGVGAVVAPTEEEAKALAASRNLWVVKMFSGQPIAFPTPEEALSYEYNEREKAILASISRRSIVGTPEQVHENLSRIAKIHQADELVVVTITYDFASRVRSYELLAKAFGLTPRP